ncbi:hypothetical protein A4H97_10340 [Niastella yeongjuensis]|uniref:SusD/RagB family nutrient-binding outer membrane lipoprotein n=1 Tax=Niastella yeongjuensis TaxID=354355 RepID=A0A1V9EFC3_9BACT|nr:SusD/RagB family nutrient-binding outer membrane lipoprotein [Niastella yeongjuensis]OQP44751.1 hypothetical protein A4H97_10340 [Niastella yeongjuensis]SEO76768.1 Starch-binding associating with outer membrane [Niastella yeongjuensis]
MRKQLFIACLVLMAVPALYSCKKGFQDLNVDPINIISTSPSRLLAPALVNSVWPGMNKNRSFTNELMQVTVAQSDGDATIFRYAFRANVSDYLWNAWYGQLTNFKQVDSLGRGGEHAKVDSANATYQGIGKVCKVWLFSNLTDGYGDIPYFHALEGDQQNVVAAFDRQKDIYLDMFDRLEEANTLLAKGDVIVPSSDPVYQGNVDKWRRFSNSLYLRLLLRISGKADVQQQCIAKIKQIVENPTQYPIFQTNADCARLLWSGGTSTTDPYTNPYVINVRTSDFKGPAICSFFLDHLVSWSDPRYVSASPYGTGSIGAFGIAQASGGGWVGVESGYATGHGVTKGCYFQSYDASSGGGTASLQQSKITGIMMQTAEVKFILAEAALKGWIGTAGDTKKYWYQGMASAINYWVAAFPEDTAASQFKTHVSNLANVSENWDESLTVEGKMELIHLQKYYALFLTDLQQWYEYRRTGHPVLPKGQGLSNGGVMPARMVYPVYIQAANPVNYKAAVVAQGNDEISTNVWWQQP